MTSHFDARHYGNAYETGSCNKAISISPDAEPLYRYAVSKPIAFEFSLEGNTTAKDARLNKPNSIPSHSQDVAAAGGAGVSSASRGFCPYATSL
jgi:hypothetical protein